MKKTLLMVALLGTVSFGAYRWLGSSETKQKQTTVQGQETEQLVLDRIWVDHLPRNERDTINVFAAISEEPFGVFQASSTWKGHYELFRYQANGNELRIVYPQNNDRETVRHKARKCSEHQMDYCLDLDGGSRGVKRYYSRKGWEIEGVKSAAELHDRADALINSL